MESSYSSLSSSTSGSSSQNDRGGSAFCKLTTTTEKMKTGVNHLQSWLNDLEKNATELHIKCDNQAANIDNLERELVTARKENVALQERLKRSEEECSKLGQMLLAREGGDDNVKGVAVPDQEINPLLLFPEEVWNMIFGYVKDPKDLKSCYEACTTFQAMLHEYRNVFLFADVVRLVGARVPEFGPPTGDTETSDLLNCRLVCSGWKKSVNYFLQEDTSTFSHGPMNPGGNVATVFQSAQNNPWTDSVIRNMSATVNPLPSRYLYYDHDWSSALQEDLLNFLRKFGHHVWFFKVNFRNVANVCSDIWYNRLLQWISLMPNLQELYVKEPMLPWFRHAIVDSNDGHSDDENGFEDNDDDDYQDYLDDDDDDRQLARNIRRDWELGLRNLQELVLVDEFPCITSLKVVTLEDVPPSVMESVLKFNPQIERLRIHQCPENQVSFSYGTCKMEMLKNACLTLRDIYDAVMNATWNITKLTLHAIGYIDGWDLVALGECFGNSLVEFDFKITNPSSEINSKQLRLPKLKKLTLSISRCFEPINFILPLAQLEYLKVELTKMHPHDWIHSCKFIGILKDEEYIRFYEGLQTDSFGELIKFHRFTHNLKDSNIWHLFPKLKEVVARTDRGLGHYDEVNREVTPKVDAEWQTCTREQVEAFDEEVDWTDIQLFFP